MRQMKVIFWSAAISLLSVSCASVEVRKLSADGKAVEGPEGIRYYRSRPFLSVHEPFVVDAKPYLLPGALTPDGKYVVITGVVPPDLASQVSVTQPIAANQVVATAAPTLDGRGQSEGTEISKPQTPKPPEEPATKPSEPAKPDAPRRTGQGQLTVSTDNSAVAVQPLRRYMDVVYLPDFDENYIISVKERFGFASAKVTLGQGWSLQGLDSTVDNSEITAPLLDFYKDSLKTLSALAKSSLGIPTLPGGQQAENSSTADRVFKAGTPLTIRITKAKLVAPGLYPQLKTAEATAPVTEGYIRVGHFNFKVYEVFVVEAIPATGDSVYSLTKYPPGSSPSTPVVQPNADAPRKTLDPTALKTQLEGAFNDVTVTIELGDQVGLTVVPKRQGAAVPLDERKDQVKARLKSLLTAAGDTRDVVLK